MTRGHEAARRHHHRPVVGRPLRRPGRRPAGGHGVASRSTSAARPPTSPAGTARLGLKSALITRVGDEHMGRFIREELAREGVDTRGVVDRPRAADRAGASSASATRSSFPLIFYRENCADMALCEDDIDPAFIAEARAVVATGTHLSPPAHRGRRAEGAAPRARERRADRARHRLPPEPLGPRRARRRARAASSRAPTVTRQAAVDLHLFDLIVGTEEEFHIAGGIDRHASRPCARCARSRTRRWSASAAPTGAVAFTGAIPDSLDDGEAGPGFPIEVFNVLGAGDGFMSGPAQGLARRRGLADGARSTPTPAAPSPSRATAARPAYPSLGRAASSSSSAASSARTCATTPSSSRSTGRPTGTATGRRCGSSPSTTACSWRRWRARRPRRSAPSRRSACRRRSGRRTAGPATASSATAASGATRSTRPSGTGLWIGRPVEWPGSRPLTLEPEIGPRLRRPRRMAAGARGQGPVLLPPRRRRRDVGRRRRRRCQRLFAAARRNRLEFLLEVIPSKVGPVDDDTTAHDDPTASTTLGVYPDWWKLEPMTDATPPGPTPRRDRRATTRTRAASSCSGSTRRRTELAASFALAARHPLVKGFAVGRTIFGEAARAWLGGRDARRRGGRRDGGALSRASAAIWDKARAARAKEERGMSKTIRLTAAQAMVRWLSRADDRGRRAASSTGVWAIFGHGNVAGIGEALHAHRRRASRPGAARTSRRWPTPPSPTPRQLAPPARHGGDLLDRPGRDQHGHRRGARPRQPPAGAASSPATSSPTAAPTRCCSRSRTSTTAPSAPTTASGRSPATSTASPGPSSS